MPQPPSISLVTPNAGPVQRELKLPCSGHISFHQARVFLDLRKSGPVPLTVSAHGQNIPLDGDKPLHISRTFSIYFRCIVNSLTRGCSDPPRATIISLIAQKFSESGKSSATISHQHSPSSISNTHIQVDPIPQQYNTHMHMVNICQSWTYQQLGQTKLRSTAQSTTVRGAMITVLLILKI